MADLKVRISQLPPWTPLDTDIIPYVDLATNTTKKALKSELKGDSWPAWPAWPQGIQGIQWPIWPQGIQGLQWEKGDKWDTWAQGVQWIQGIQWKWINTVTSNKVWKTTTVTISWTFDNSPQNFQILDWEGSWDMSKSIYDTNNNGIVDNSEALNWQAGSYYLNTDNHTNWTTNKVFTALEQSKLSWIEAGAEVNNISDTNATDLTDWWDTTLHTHDWRYYTETETNSLLSNKQDTLVSWTNIKTVNGTSLLWSWNIVISGWWLSYSEINSSQSISTWNYYWVTCSSDITLTLPDWTSVWDSVSIKKLDNTNYTIIINGNIELDWSITMDTQFESIDLYWNWIYYLIK